MLEDLAAHILDIAQNSVSAGAKKIEVIVYKSESENFSGFEIIDDGKGMNTEQLQKALSPFGTSRTTRRVGMGLPFLKQLAEQCNGKFEIFSVPGKGTRVLASFALNNIDTPPMGDLAWTFITLMIDASVIHWIFKYNSFELDSLDLSDVLGDLESLSSPQVALALKNMIEDGINSIV